MEKAKVVEAKIAELAGQESTNAQLKAEIAELKAKIEELTWSTEMPTDLIQLDDPILIPL